MDQKNVLASFPELSGFEPVTTVNDLEAALGRLPGNALRRDKIPMVASGMW